MSVDAWHGTDGFEDPSVFTYEVRHWAATLLRDMLDRKMTIKDVDVPGWFLVQKKAKNGVTVAEVTEWLLSAERRGDVVAWYPHDEFQGSGFASGRWSMNWQKVLDALRSGVDAIQKRRQRANDAARFQSLDAWLAADIAGDLEYRGAFGGRGAIPNETAERLAREAKARQKRLLRGQPTTCVCGKEFTRDRSNATHCTTCRAGRRAKQQRDERVS